MEYRVKRLEGISADQIGSLSIDPDRWDEDGCSLSLDGDPDKWLNAWNASAETA